MNKTLDEAWAAGLFEGEGCITTIKKRGRGGTTRYLRLCLSSTDDDVLRRFHDVVALGVVRGPSTTTGSKPIWNWTAAGAAAHQVLYVLLPHLGARRADRACELLEERSEGLAA